MPLPFRGMKEISTREPALLLAGVTLVLVFSGSDPVADRLTWFLETFPVMIGIVLLVLSRRNFPLTLLLYRLLALHALILIFGGHYTYAENPLFNWIRDLLELSRNHYDRVGHLAQGFIPAILAREILLRRSPLKVGGWLFFLVTCICLAFSAFYEMIEWWVALLSEEAAEAFLGTQGDNWDTQWDMFMALLGAMASQLLLARMHDAQIARLPVPRQQ
jgi:putative membrane protein